MSYPIMELGQVEHQLFLRVEHVLLFPCFTDGASVVNFKFCLEAGLVVGSGVMAK